ncbi:SDR family NAD(P)-dependent oxidoreductase [Aquiflexum gelatinilyticum]|uniref:SDR family NAD(P)-dependent oxidoreductase n=1 Tax=Aquiflexum gelatinilyticum TaxID=2961943 RepID=A0A9X2P5I9_9BACT|nr:SDR family NAD(P)-dependent oxidoreductase [Aquiflexum gelatinilyticum]MCR9015757.1 SDR family NAD(P)-dependent oxidoreductase [Aquiflexum gelatinilyticum]
MSQYALITGARKGLGKAFAIELSKRKINTILVSRPNDGLQNLCEELKEKYQVDCRYFETDLSVYNNLIDLADWVNLHFDIIILINNVGTGGTIRMTDASIEYIDKILKLNIVTTSVLTHQLLPNLLRQPKGYILNVSSLAAHLPIGFKTVYPASKSFISSFSRGLNQELKGSNVSVSVVSPGPIRTNGDVVKRISKGYFGKFMILEPEEIAKKCIRQLFERKAEIIVNPMVWLLIKFLPTWITTPLMSRIAKKELG